MGKCGKVCWGVGKVRGSVRRCVEKGVGKNVGVWGELREDKERGLGEWGSMWGIKKRWRRCGEVLGEVWERVEEISSECGGCEEALGRCG